MSIKNLFHSEILNSTLAPLKVDIKKNLKIFSHNIKDLKNKMTYLQNIFNDLEDQEHSKEIAKIFKETIEISIDEMERYLQEQEKAKEEFYLFEERFIEYIINIISAIITFQKQLDNLYPNLSKIIIDYLSDFLVGLLATQVPIVALAIKGSGILDALKSYISAEGLTNTLNNWKDKLTQVQTKLNEVREDKVLKKQFILVKQVIEISEITGISVISIAELGLHSKSLKQIKGAISQNPKTIKSFEQIVELSKSIPHSKDSIIKTINKLATEINKILENILGVDERIKKTIKNELSNVKDNLIQAATPNKNIMEKLEYCYKAAKSIFNIYNKISETIKSTPNKNKVVENFGNLIKEQTKNIIPSIFLKNLTSLTHRLEPLSKIIKIENMLKIAFENDSKRTRFI